MRNLDVTTLRSFVAVADLGGVTRAAGVLNLTQSAVSMQIKRLEDLLGLSLLDRSGRGVSLTPSGAQLLGYARRMVELNDEMITRLTDQIFEGEIVLGVPHDIVYPVIPRVLQRFAALYPRVKVQLITTFTRDLLARFGRGECDLILTTEFACPPVAETLTELPLRWVGAQGGVAWRQRPLRLASGRYCLFRPRVLAALDAAGIAWDLAVDTESDRTIEASLSADLAVAAFLEGTQPQHLELIEAGSDLPGLGVQKINMYGEGLKGEGPVQALGDQLRQAFRTMQAGQSPALMPVTG